MLNLAGENLSNFLNTLSIVKPAVSIKDFSPLLKCFNFTPNKIMGYNGELFIETTYVHDLEGSVNAEILLKLLGSLNTTEEVTFTVKENFLHIQTQRTNVKLPLLTDTFPVPEYTEDIGTSLLLSAADYQAIKSCLPFISTNEIQQVYRGVYIGKNNIYGTDGFRLSRHITENPMEINLLLPDAFCQELIKYNPTIIHQQGGGIHFNTRTIKVHSALTSVKVPNYEDVFEMMQPIVNKRLLPITEDLKTALNRLPIFISSVDKYCKLTFNPTNLQLEVTDSQLGNIQEEISVNSEYEPESIIVDLPMFQSIINVCDSIELIDSNPKLIRGVKDNFEVFLTTIEL